MGTASTPFFSAVTMSAEAERPGLSSWEGFSRVMMTLKSLDLLGGGGGVLEGRAADLGHLPLENRVRVGVHPDVRGLPEPDCDDVRLVHFDLDLHDGQVGDGHQDGAGVVHRADDGDFALFDPEAGDHAVDGGDEVVLLRLSRVLLREASACWIWWLIACTWAPETSNWALAASSWSLERSCSS